MDIDKAFKDIRNIYQIVSSKVDPEVTLTYKGNSFGVTKVYHVRCDQREFSHETHDGALHGLITMLKLELTDKTKSTEKEALRLNQALNQFNN
jgi:hypothetical protein